MSDSTSGAGLEQAGPRRVRKLRIAWIRWRINHSPKALNAALDDVRDLWKRALEREGNLASAVADVMWKATPYGTTEDGDIFAYIVPKGCVHRLIGVAQSNGAHVSVSFRALPAADAPLDPS